MKFIGRKKESHILQKKLESDKSELIIIYGRRRLGKTTLMKNLLSKVNNGSYYLSVQESIEKNIKYLRDLLAKNLDNKLIANLKADSFIDFFELVIDLIPKNYTIMIDEFPYLISQDKGIISQFQKVYDEYLKPKGINLVLCGSSISMMTDLMSYKSPLYGRRTYSLNLKEFSLYETKLFLKNVNLLDDVIKYHLIFGGVPYYLEQIDQSKSFEENFRSFFFEGQSMFLDEVLFLLKEEFREVRSYISILYAISKGKSKFSQIADDALMDKGALSRYLINLELLDIVENVRSFFDKQNSKKTIYKIKDNFIYFWFSVLKKHLGNIDNKQVQKKILDVELPRSLGFLFEMESQKILSKKFERIGTYFKNEVEIDIVGIEDEKLYFYECKFKNNINYNFELKKLKEKIEGIVDYKNYEYNIISIESGIDIKKLLNMSKQ